MSREYDGDGDWYCVVAEMDDGCGSCLARASLDQLAAGVTSILHLAPSLHQQIVGRCTFHLFTDQHLSLSSQEVLHDARWAQVPACLRMTRPGTLVRDISPPPLRKTSTISTKQRQTSEHEAHAASEDAGLAAVEAGQVEIRDHLTYFVKHLSACSRPTTGPRISFPAFEDLYTRNQHKHGRHFIVHQHDHPISGTAGHFTRFLGHS